MADTLAAPTRATHLVTTRLRNLRWQDPAHLVDELRLAVKRVRHKRAVLRGCLRQCGYGV